MTQPDMFEFDELQMFFGEDYKVNDYITIHQPTIGEIVEFGERNYYSMVHALTCIPSDMKSQLFDAGIDYEEISDFELFIMLSKSLQQEQTRLLFGNLDFSKMSVYKDTAINELVLFNPETGEKVDKLAYLKIFHYLCKVHGIKPKIEKAANKTTKRILIQLDRDRLAKSKDQPYKSQLKTLISSMLVYPGFKYKKSELKECGLYEFTDSVQRAQIYVNTTALITGSYSGMIDASKINKKEFDWFRDYSNK